MADIQLSPQLFQDIHQAVERLHPNADTGIVLQYLAAVSGYLLGSERNMSPADKEAYLTELCNFAERVYRDVQGQQQRPAAPPAGDAFGYWEPPKKD
ncbi:MAG: hypothetical protein D6720_08215 [Gammaproteobacteria bacterium]|nr:MAG: hypothetical protein D6720_08215 [Gammaproteobacteria bacterium]